MQEDTRSSGRERAYRHLRSTVLTDPDVTGTFINEQQVATHVGVSRTPVREALLMLAAEDLVQLVPNRGAFVAPVPARQIAEMMQARGVIECWAARSCLRAAQPPVREMRRNLAQQRRLLGAPDARAFIECDRQFHAILVDAAGNQVLGRMYGSLRARQVLLGLVALRSSATRRQEVLDEHQAILRALLDGDAAACEAAILAHLETTRAVLSHG
jgi:DNA-binding GntR family transcriptional regulator